MPYEKKRGKKSFELLAQNGSRIKAERKPASGSSTGFIACMLTAHCLLVEVRSELKAEEKKKNPCFYSIAAQARARPKRSSANSAREIHNNGLLQPLPPRRDRGDASPPSPPSRHFVVGLLGSHKREH